MSGQKQQHQDCHFRMSLLSCLVLVAQAGIAGACAAHFQGPVCPERRLTEAKSLDRFSRLVTQTCSLPNSPGAQSWIAPLVRSRGHLGRPVTIRGTLLGSLLQGNPTIWGSILAAFSFYHSKVTLLWAGYFIREPRAKQKNIRAPLGYEGTVGREGA